MKLSFRWLGRHVDLDGKSPEQVRDDLTLSTAEVEGVETLGAGLEQIVVGHVVECGRHPDADKLSVTKVDAGTGELLTIVCGAPNVAQGQKIAVALPGVTLPGETKPLKKAKLRGVESNGMICSERELRLSDEHHGILVLPAGARVGASLPSVLPVQDHVIEIDNKSINHRPDLWGHRGVARELAAIWGRPLHSLPSLVALPATGQTRAIVVEDPRACPRYCGLVIDGVVVAPSPAWLQRLLVAVGQRPINNLVDLTNFVMLDLGQPMHAFDLRRLDPAGIVVRHAREGESMRTLDGVERKLVPGDLLITSGGRAVALAGVMGGEESMVADDTRAIFLESATFHAATVRRTGVRLGLRTDSSARFEKALDPANAEVAVHAFLHALGEAGGGRAAGPIVDPTAWRFAPRRIALRKARLDLKLGKTLPGKEVEGILRSLEFDVRATATGFDVGVPSFRATKDIAIEDDLIEEVGRMHRYDNIAEVPLVAALTVPHREPELWLARTLVKLGATELGCHEVYNYSFVPDALLAACRDDAHGHVQVKNPVAPEQAQIRRHVLPSLLGAVQGNLRVVPEVRLMELGKGYHPENRDAHGLPEEVLEFALVAAREDGAEVAPALRSGVASMLRRVGMPVTFTDRAASGDVGWLHPGRSAALARGGREVGYLGRIHPQVARALTLPATTAIANIDIRALLATGRAPGQMQPISRFPSQTVDVALVVPSATRVADVETFLRRAGKKLVGDVTLFEVYRGDRLPPGTKSLNFTVVLSADDRTLTADDEARFLQRVREGASEIGAELRG